ncbi:hypothetical protein [Pararhodonellum marinum]|uniref:hypothetical protein n=1 Tax=Pararhodonellum marinum TaxID=2755358 RepID=UPI00188F2945|nr:hypothetical protein [Pararhodonellum marinum]
MSTLTLNNVMYDRNSIYGYESLNESQYVEKLFEELKQYLGVDFENYEFFVFAHSEFDQLPQSIAHKSGKKKVLYYIADSTGHDPSYLSDEYFLVFKTHMRDSYESDNVVPVPLGYVNDVPAFPITPIHERPLNVFFSGDLNRNRLDLYRSFSALRYFMPKKGYPTEQFRQFLLSIKKDFSDYFKDSLIVFNNGFKTGLDQQEYGKVLAESKIVLAPSGFSRPECFRHIEAMRAGCVIISDKLPEKEFYTDSPIIQVDNWKEGLSKAKKLLSDKPMLQDYHLRTVDWWENVCSEKAVAQYMGDKLRQF